eukprot:TRINITY_DN5725_c0_g1_i1.p1 TRINITY_DN5725_c0_g1~~TRINITY_DN5725_c0_g1_i1.p1  ORF type:complete len:181 (-),score=29.42 TRINITY_DN5725_c0_g1_i1:1-543(-)
MDKSLEILNDLLRGHSKPMTPYLEKLFVDLLSVISVPSTREDTRHLVQSLLDNLSEEYNEKLLFQTAIKTLDHTNVSLRLSGLTFLNKLVETSDFIKSDAFMLQLVTKIKIFYDCSKNAATMGLLMKSLNLLNDACPEMFSKVINCFDKTEFFKLVQEKILSKKKIIKTPYMMRKRPFVF